MKSIYLFTLAILLFISEGHTQTICFENFAEKVVIPSQKALALAKTDKERDSLRFAPADAIKNLVGCVMPDFTAQTLNGQFISKQSLKGKVVVMNFWFIGCKPCLAELPALNTLVEQYKGKEVVFIAFGRDSKQQTVEKFLPKHEFKFQLVTEGKDYADKFLANATGVSPKPGIRPKRRIAARPFRWLYR